MRLSAKGPRAAKGEARSSLGGPDYGIDIRALIPYRRSPVKPSV